MLGNVFPVFVVVLSEHTFTDEYNLVSDLSSFSAMAPLGNSSRISILSICRLPLYSFRKAGIYNGIHSFSLNNVSMSFLFCVCKNTKNG